MFISVKVVCNLRAMAIIVLVALIAVIAFATLRPGVHAESTAVVTLYPDADTRISEGNPTTNYNGQQLQVSFYTLAGGRDQSLIHFDFSGVPTDIVINQAVLRVYVRDVAGAVPQDIIVRRVLDTWDEGAVTWNTRPGVGTVQAVTSVGTQGWATWNVTAQVQRWVDGVDGKYGFYLVGPVGVASYGFYLASKEVTPAAELVIDYDFRPTNTPLPTFTPTATATLRPTLTPTATGTAQPTLTPTTTGTPLPTQTASPTKAATATATTTPVAGAKNVRDLGDAPDSSNGAGIGMNAYPGVPASFPSVFAAGSPPYGPLHHNASLAFTLGDSITHEEEADTGFDSDGVHNIDPAANLANQDGGDDGLGSVPAFSHCTTVTIQFDVLAYTTAPDHAYFNLWADWDRNGRWGDEPSCGATVAPEWAVQNQVVSWTTPGFYTFTTPAFLVFNAASARDMWLRITLSDKPLPVPQAGHGGGPPSGFDFGETEDYLIRGVLPTATPTPTLSPTPTVTPTFTATPTYTPTPTPTPTSVPDLGDAPDSTNTDSITMWAYPTVVAQFPTVYGAGSPPYGPLHHNSPLRFNLGEMITAEEEADTGYDQDGINNLVQGQPDNDGQDDGVILPDFLNHCNVTRLSYTVRVIDPSVYGSDAYLNVWLDFDRNGKWGDTYYCAGIPVPEWAVQNEVVKLSSYYTSYTTPSFPIYNKDITEDIWVRVTLSESPTTNADGSGPAGGYSDGETEDYLWIAPYDFEVTGLEVSQGIQNLNNDMPLIEDRRTIVRAYIQETTGRDVSGVNARLYGERGGSSLSGSPLDAENQPITVWADGGDRLNIDDSFWFYLPTDWRSGDVTLRVEVNYDDAVKEQDKSDNEMEVSVSFEAADPLNMMFSPLHLHEGADRNNPTQIYWCTEDDCDELYNSLIRYHPIADLNVWRFEDELKPTWHGWPFYKEWDPNDASDASSILSRLQWKRFWTADPASPIHYYGMVHEYFSARGLGYLPGLDALGTMDSDTWANTPWYMWGGETMAHELGHNQGLKHVECDGTEASGGAVDSDYPWPYPDCSLADVDSEGYYGLDVYYNYWSFSEPYIISNDPSASSPNQGFPLMGYQSPNWISPWEYCKLLEEYGVSCGLSWSMASSTRHSLSAQTQAAIAALQNADEYVLVGGVLDADRGEVWLDPSYRLIQPPAESLAEAIQALQMADVTQQDPDWQLTLEDATGAILYSHPVTFNLDFHDGARVTTLNALLPLPVGTHWIRVRQGDTVAAEQEISTHAPQVQVLWPNGGEQVQVGSVLRWSGSDADGDDLVYTLLYSADAGASWRALALDVGETELTVTAQLLADMLGSDQALLKVVTSDGVNTGEDVSDVTFSVPGSPPQAIINSPRDGTITAPGRLVILDGVGLDVEEGTVRGQSLRWSSDRDGFLGSGQELALHELSPGVHHITLSVSDEDGMTGEASVTIFIGEGGLKLYLPVMMH